MRAKLSPLMSARKYSNYKPIQVSFLKINTPSDFCVVDVSMIFSSLAKFKWNLPIWRVEYPPELVKLSRKTSSKMVKVSDQDQKRSKSFLVSGQTHKDSKLIFMNYNLKWF